MDAFDYNFIPNLGGQTSILARDMVVMLQQKLYPQVDLTGQVDEFHAPDPYDEYQKYGSHKEFCRNVFNETYSEDIERVMDSVDERVITIAKSANGVGKSHAAARISVSFYKRYKDAQVYTAAAPPESNLDIILWGQIKSLVTSHPEVFSNDKVATGKYIGSPVDPLHYIIGLPIPQSSDSAQRKARFSGKHAPHMLFVLDEGDAIPFEIYEAIESCMSGGYVRLLVMFNPRADVGPLSKMEKNGTGRVVKIKAFSHPNVLTGQNVFPGAVDRETTVRRINEWTVPMGHRDEPDRECFEVPDFLVGYVAYSHAGEPYPALKAGMRRIVNPAFSYMVLAEYPAVSENQLISQVAIDRARARWAQHYSLFGNLPPRAWARPTMGVDVAEYGLDETVVALKYDNWVAPFETWRFTDPDKTATEAALIYRNKKVSYANVDANGVGAGVAPRMFRSGCEEVYGLKAQSKPDMKALSPEQAELGEFYLLRDYMWWSMKEWIEKDPYAMIPPDELLEEELKFASYVQKRGAIQVLGSDVFREKLGRSPDRATALALACTDRFEDITGEVSTENYAYGDETPHGVTKGNFVGYRS